MGDQKRNGGRRPPAGLEEAVLACDRALVDYQAGLLDDDQLRRVLYHCGIVLGDGHAWLLDVERGAWCRYDGIAAGDPVDEHVRSPFDGATIRRWRTGLRDLIADLRRDAPASSS